MKAKRYAALARVSSREQEREGFSLDVQEDAFNRYVAQNNGSIVKFYKIAETASKRTERKVFKELLAYCRVHAKQLDGLLFFKVDRAARNLFDYVELERLESDHGVKVVYISQPTENTPAGRMMRRTLANMAAFYTEQQSLDVKEGIARRVQSGLFPSKATYGLCNVRKEGRSIVQVHPEHGPKVPLLFNLFSRGAYTLDSLLEALPHQGILYTQNQPLFSRSKLHTILKDRSYLGEFRYHDAWHPGTHPVLVDRETFFRVQQLLGLQVYRAHEMLFAGELIRCGFCGHPITGECKTKKTLKGSRDYTYYRCARYTSPGHPRIRLSEKDVEMQVLAAFARLRIPDEKVRAWFGQVLQARIQEAQKASAGQAAELQRQLASLRSQQDRLLNMRLLDEIDEQTFATKAADFRDRIAQLNSQTHDNDESRGQQSQEAVKAFELSQVLEEKWLEADFKKKRQLLETVCLNFTLRDVTLEITMRKPFDVLIEGLSVL
jgi:site-specific DNA recombinase